jgi:hypothetical protein
MSDKSLLTPFIGEIVALELDPKKSNQAYNVAFVKGIYGGSDKNGILFGLIENIGEYFKARAEASGPKELADVDENFVVTQYIPWGSIINIRLYA